MVVELLSDAIPWDCSSGELFHKHWALKYPRSWSNEEEAVSPARSSTPIRDPGASPSPAPSRTWWSMGKAADQKLTKANIFQSYLRGQHLPSEPGSDLAAALQCHRHLQPTGAGLRLCSQDPLLLRNKGSKRESREFGEGYALQWLGGFCHISLSCVPPLSFQPFLLQWHQYRFRWTAKKVLSQQKASGRRI